MTRTEPSYEMSDEGRAAAEELADSDNPLAPIARLLIHLDDNHREQSDE